jgi:hypothetical protein
MRRFASNVLLLAAGLLAVLPLSAADANVAGGWTVTADMRGQALVFHCVFKQDGGKLSGTCSNEVYGDLPTKGEVEDKSVGFGFRADLQGFGEPSPVSFNGNLDTDTTISGNMAINDFGGTFTAKKD